MSKLRLAMAQMDISTGNWEKNCQRAQSFLEKAYQLEAKLFILPEMWSTGFFVDNFSSLARSTFNSTFDLIRLWARRYRLYLVAGSIPEVAGERIFNTSFFISPQGEIIGYHRKRRLFPSFHEPELFYPGNELEVFPSPWGPLGILICFELRFPTDFQVLRKKGANIVVLPAQFPNPRENHWMILNRARAIENQVYLFACNRVGENKGQSFFGSSLIVDPWGEVLINGREGERLIATEIDLSLVDKVREEFPLPLD